MSKFQKPIFVDVMSRETRRLFVLEAQPGKVLIGSTGDIAAVIRERVTRDGVTPLAVWLSEPVTGASTLLADLCEFAEKESAQEVSPYVFTGANFMALVIRANQLTPGKIHAFRRAS